MWIWRSPNCKMSKHHQNTVINVESKYVLMKKLILYVTTAKIKVTKIFMHLWYVCFLMTNVLVEILVKFHNWPIGFWIQSNEPHDTRGFRFYTGYLEYMDKHIEVADGHQVIAKQKVQVWIRFWLSWISFHRNVTQHNFVTIFLWWFIELRIYLFVPQRFLHCVIGSKIE